MSNSLTDKKMNLAAMTKEELRKWQFSLVAELQSVESQLSSRNRINQNGRRMNDKEFWSWRENAVKKKHEIVQKIQDVKLAIGKRATADDQAQKITREEMDESVNLVCANVGKLVGVIRELMKEKKKLIAENEGLYAKINQLEIELMEKNAPNDGREVWRDDNYDLPSEQSHISNKE